MLEYPEIKTIALQARQHLVGKTIGSARLLTPEKKFVFSSNRPDDFSRRLEGGTIESVQSCGNHLFLETSFGSVLNIGDTGGKMLFHLEEESIPKKRDMQLDFTDGTFLTHSVTMWGFISAQTSEETIAAIDRIRDEAMEPVRAEVDVEAFLSFIHQWGDAERTNDKKLIISRKYFTGLGNGYAQDILWRAGIHPRRKMHTVGEDALRGLFFSFLDVVAEAIDAEGRTTERTLLNKTGRYEPAMYRGSLGQPCSKCGTVIEKFAFEGGACYICPECQRI